MITHISQTGKRIESYTPKSQQHYRGKWPQREISNGKWSNQPIILEASRF